MAWRTNEDEVKRVLGKDYDESAQGNRPLTHCIRLGNLLTNRIAAADSGGLLNRDELIEIETYLAAWTYGQSDKMFSSRSIVGNNSASFSGKWDKSLENNNYGQTAILLDVTGYLARLKSRNVASSDWLGKTVPEQLSYHDRNR